MLRIALVSLLALAPALAFAAPTKVAVDTTASSVKWTGSKSLVDSKHNGTVKLSPSSFLMMNKDKITGGEIVVDMTTIENEDQKDPGYKAKLEGHLKSEDFFNVEKYKEAKFVVKKTTPNKDGSLLVDGDLTIRDVTAPAAITVKTAKDGKAWVATGTMKFDRSKFNVKYGSKAFFPDLVKKGKDKVIADEIDLDFTVKTAAK
jgi:polyisoprenoid-binding protein YceI